MTQPVSPDLIACVVRLTATHGTTMERSQGHRAHALFLRLIEQADPDLAARLHAPAPVKPWTVTPLPQHEVRLQPGDGYPLRVSFLQPELYEPFARTFLFGDSAPIVLGEGSFVLREVVTTAQSSHWAGVTTWHELIGRALPQDTLTLRFATPTAFTQSEAAHGRKRALLLPDGHTVFKSLVRRWNAFAPITLPDDLLEHVTFWPSRYDLKTVMQLIGKHKQIGFVGEMTYEIDGSEQHRHLITALADAAKYLGVGYKTTQGMGLARRIRARE